LPTVRGRGQLRDRCGTGVAHFLGRWCPA